MIKITGKRISSITVVYASLTAFVLLMTVFSCKSRSIMTEPLFMQAKRANIGLPAEGFLIDSVTGEVVVSESVTYENPDNNRSSASMSADTSKNKKVDLSAVQRLSEVVVTAQSRFTPEREGRVTVDFMIKVPKELLASQWRVQLQPTILHNDSLVPLQEVILKGEAFDKKQKSDYAAYNDFVKSIVDRSDYDKKFVDRERILKDMRKRQNFYWNKYYKEWSQHRGYEKWKFARDDQDAFYTAKYIGAKFREFNKASFNVLEASSSNIVSGKDTTGLYAKYFKDYNRKEARYPSEWVATEMDINKVPKKYREIHLSGRTPHDVDNEVLTERDSIQIAQTRYLFDEIALNEAGRATKKEFFKRMVKHPYGDKNKIRLDTLVNTEEDFVFYYSQDYPVVEGLKGLRITMDSKVQALDRSAYILAESDTISYVISSLIQLIDTTLMAGKSGMRNTFNFQTIYPKYLSPGDSHFDIHLGDNEAQLAKFFATYHSSVNERGMVVDSINMIASTGMIGTFVENDKLTQRRIAEITNYLGDKMPDGVNTKKMFKPSAIGEDWAELNSLVLRRDDLRNKREILRLLERAVAEPDACKSELRERFPEDFRIIRDSIYPMLQKVEFTFNMHKLAAAQVQTAEQSKIEAEYAEGIRLLQDREYTKALDILSNYPDYNMALCLACLGYNAKAYDLSLKLDQNSNTEYLLAITAFRIGGKDMEELAVGHLVKSCELDPAKLYRIPLDSETRMLMMKYNLQERIDGIYGKQDSEMMDELLLDDADDAASTEQSQAPAGGR